MSGLASLHAHNAIPRVPEEMRETLPTLFGDGYGIYRTRPLAFIGSFLLHGILVVAIVASAQYVVEHRKEIRQQIIELVSDVSPYTLPPSLKEAGGGGGGGDRDRLEAPRGALPKSAMEQFTPPMVVVRNESPKLVVEPTVVVPPEIQLPHAGALGDPMSNVLGPASNGPGYGGGIGSGSGGGVGSGRGPGVGPGSGGGIGGGVFRVGGGVTPPKALYAPDPEFSEEARKAKYQGTVVLRLIVSAEGGVRDIQILRSLGMGLDEKAIEAVRRWRFEPARRAGVPVAVEINVEVTYRLY